MREETKELRVLVVEDSLTVRKRLVEVLDAAADMSVVGEAENGRQAIELCEKLRPDVITMDMVLPVMSGLAATEYIMAYCPTPILVVSASSNRRELFKTYEALSAGALAVFEKPSGTTPAEQWQDRLVRRVRMVAGIAVVTHPRGRLARSAAARPAPAADQRTAPSKATSATRRTSDQPRVLAIGASTGGPRAVLTILQRLPANYPIPILLVIHIGSMLGSAMADWLDSQVPLQVAFATDAEPVPSVGRGQVVMAPPEHHMVVDADTIRLTQDPPRHHCKPSVDILFESVARSYGDRGAGCLLTGMGRDGAAGLAEIASAGGATMAQDEPTSVVFGMPGEAIRLGAAQKVLALDDFAPAFIELAGSASMGGAR